MIGAKGLFIFEAAACDEMFNAPVRGDKYATRAGTGRRLVKVAAPHMRGVPDSGDALIQPEWLVMSSACSGRAWERDQVSDL